MLDGLVELVEMLHKRRHTLRDMFRGYYQPTSDEVEAIWSTGLISLDANVLLSLYNVLPTTSSLYLGAMEKRQPQMWLPYQVALEFHRNVHKERARQTIAHLNRIKQIDGLLGELRSTARKSRFQASVVQDRAVKGLTALKEELVAQKDTIAEQTNHRTPDALLERISMLFEGRVGPEPNETTLDALYKEGENRFSSQIPPGYEDAKTKVGNRKYGDYVLWRQLMDQAAREKSDVIFVTDDDKADWWLKIDKTSVAPRPELIQEFRSKTGQNILILNSSDYYYHLVPAADDNSAMSKEVIAAQEDMKAAVIASKTMQFEQTVNGLLDATNFREEADTGVLNIRNTAPVDRRTRAERFVTSMSSDSLDGFRRAGNLDAVKASRRAQYAALLDKATILAERKALIESDLDFQNDRQKRAILRKRLDTIEREILEVEDRIAEIDYMQSLLADDQ